MGVRSQRVHKEYMPRNLGQGINAHSLGLGVTGCDCGDVYHNKILA